MGEDKNQGWTKPGHIPEPKEKSWTEEDPNPYDKINRGDPFEGRPKTELPNHDDDPGGGAAEPPAPGQPLPRRDDE